MSNVSALILKCLQFVRFIFTAKKFYLMGAPGTFRAENANALKDEFNKQCKSGNDWRTIHTGEILKRTAEKKTELGNKIKASLIANQYGKLFYYNSIF